MNLSEPNMNLSEPNQVPPVQSLIESMVLKIKHLQLDKPLIIGIHTGGAWLAKKIHRALEIDEPMGSIDISFYRDDYQKIGFQPNVKGSNLPVNLDNRQVLLVDDVIYTGRTIRAAMNEIFDYARPSSITLAALIDRGGRELPIQAEIVGLSIKLNPGQQIKLIGPEDLKLELSLIKINQVR